MSTSKDGKDPKGKSVGTVIAVTPPRVLLVEDSLSDVLTTSINLKLHNVLVSAVPVPRIALEALNALLAQDLVVNLVLTVDRVPDGGMSGYDLLMEIKKSPKFNHLPVVIMSDLLIPERVQKCLDGGAKNYIQKPINFAGVRHGILSYI
ncbi:unnamed protein product [Urochloa decumbens]|uniref:Response regulatory domain-containing protein n=1 Tax=Urochloa decumbens TaxID=240449 RepID=A0ABC9BFC1_9POAL